jgi:16S rRNA (guanine527-N7)-methyltransferase
MCVAVPADEAALPEGFFQAIGLSPEREREVSQYRDLLVHANEHMNLVGPSTIEEFWRRHFLDSAQLLWFAPDAMTWADLGSGAGLPGLILAILLKDRPGGRVHLVESMSKRCRFLSEVVEALDLPAVVHNARAEQTRLQVDVVTARACAPLARLLGYAEPFFERGARGLFLKGREVETELADAMKIWKFNTRAETSLSDPRGRLLWVEELRRVKPR